MVKSLSSEAGFSKPTGQASSLKEPEFSHDQSATYSTCDKAEGLVPKEIDTDVSCPEKIQLEKWANYVNHTPVMTLREQFKQAAHSHKNMLQRVKTHGAVVDPAFKEFKSFLIHMGTPPAKGATLDRIDPQDPEYAPGKVRWADKVTQANNKTSTIIVHDPVTGESYTISQLAKKRGIPPATLRKQRARGASDYELIHGKSPAYGLKAASSDDPETAELRKLFLDLYDQFDFTRADVDRVERNFRKWFWEKFAAYYELGNPPLKHASSQRERYAQLFDIGQPEFQHIELIHRHYAAEKVPEPPRLSEEALEEWWWMSEEAYARQQEYDWLREMGAEPDTPALAIELPSQVEWAAARRPPSVGKREDEKDDFLAEWQRCVDAALEAPVEDDSEYDDDCSDPYN